MGTFGQFVCSCISAFSHILPPTPPDLTLASLSQQVVNQVPFVGQSIILEAAQSVSLVLGLVAPYKIYKIIAGRF
ncbi:hypothetical protein MC7420_4382 [Coleofasciculus chthonoplastes PCC 7420]|uniref:Uncharacterized protein n=1 Tax=Coleofasciculus chthonoplastes PCC 7420 TaxID=118168 RepID=B4VY66_9CYAN|nr:hypothetical protein [Coleofasciculus chthonoplastes]EDX73135.1 hypothetical protein MC7420_4382 [Coleofasciculus chthonoplastes PCC 7420]